MAYLHCHTKDCDWSQDDFWSWRYNPITKFWDSIKWLAYPRLIELDNWLVDDLEQYTGVKVRKYKPKNPGQIRVNSWNWLYLEFWKQWKIYREQRWWTYKSWQKHKSTAVCPRCGLRNFDID